MYSVQYLAKKTTRVPGPEPTAKLVGTMVQDSVQKKERQCKKKQIHIRKSRSNPETQTLRNSLKTQIQIYAKKKKTTRSSVQTEKKKKRNLYNPKLFIHIQTN